MKQLTNHRDQEPRVVECARAGAARPRQRARPAVHRRALRSHPREHLPAVLDLVASKRFDPMQIVPLIGHFNDAPKILLESPTKVIVRRAPLGVQAPAMAS